MSPLLPVNRPDPDDLLARIEAEEKQRAHGRLKIFFGYAAGVGKTYAMLNAARQKLFPRMSDCLRGVYMANILPHGRSTYSID